MSFANLRTMAQVNAKPRAVPKHLVPTKRDRAIAKKQAKAEDEKKCERCGKPVTAVANRFCGRNCAASYRADKTRQPRKACALCGKQRPLHNLNGCSAKCAYTLRKLKTRAPRICPVCKKEYFHKGRVRLKFCSRRCYDTAASANAWLDAKCVACGVKVRRRVVRKTRAHIFCSRACRIVYFIGKNHPCWRGERDPNRGSGWKRRAASVRKRDGYVCQRCGRTQEQNGGSLDVDHIKPWRSFIDKDEANAPTNLVSLCKKCHCHKTSAIERAWLRGDVLAMQQYARAVKLPPLMASIAGL